MRGTSYNRFGTTSKGIDQTSVNGFDKSSTRKIRIHPGDTDTGSFFSGGSHGTLRDCLHLKSCFELARIIEFRTKSPICESLLPSFVAELTANQLGPPNRSRSRKSQRSLMSISSICQRQFCGRIFHLRIPMLPLVVGVQLARPAVSSRWLPHVHQVGRRRSTRSSFSILSSCAQDKPYQSRRKDYDGYDSANYWASGI